MTQRNLRQKPRISYFEPEEPDLDEFVFCEKCGDYVYEYCSLHGPLLVIPDDKVPAKPNVPSYVPRAALTIPHVFLHITYSIIPDAGLGVFSSMTLPSGVRFGPYQGQRTDLVDSSYCWQIYDKNRKPIHCVDAADANKSNWMRYVNCARHWKEQNLVAYQYQGELYYRTIKIIPRFTELMVFYGSEFACELDVDLGKYNSPAGYAQKFGAPVAKKRKPNNINLKTQEEEINTSSDETATKNVPTNNQVTSQDPTTKDITNEIQKGQVNITITKPEQVESTKIQNKTTKLCNRAKKAKGDQTTRNNMDTENSSIAQTKEVKSILQTPNIMAKNNNNTINKIKDSKKSAALFNTSEQNLYIYCNDCNKRCVTKRDLQKHLRFHDPKRAYACEVCKLRYISLNNLNMHTNTHTKHRTYTCKICNKAFTQSSSLKIHMRTHTREKPYTCEICNRGFTQNSDLKIHMRTHTREKPYACEICNRGFTQNSDLNKHMRKHTGEKPYTCGICNTTFTTNGHLNYHVRTHTREKPYTCEICNKGFTQNSDLKKHKRTHTGEMPYACEICNKVFTRNDTLKIHMITHTEKKPYACEICNAAFSLNAVLKNHIVKIHLKR